MKHAIFVALLILLLPLSSWGLATTMEFGVRGAVDEAGVDENYSAVEVYYQQALTSKKQISPGVMVYVRLDAGAAYLTASSDHGGWFAVGGDVVLSLLDGLWEIEGGWRPTYLFDDEFGQDDFGGPVQFSSHIGTSLHLGNFSLNYRFQHISNAGIYDENPGLDLHLVGVGARF